MLRKYDNGVFGEYFSNTTLSCTPTLTRGDLKIDFNYGTNRLNSAPPFSATATSACSCTGGLYSHLGGQWQDKTFYGIGEWILRQMKIPRNDYMALAKDFNPSEFDAKEIVRVAKEAGMKWIIITSKHHEGFAMFKDRAWRRQWSR